MRTWFERGIDGFRVDAIFAAVKDDQLRDNPPDRRPHHIPGLGVAEGVKDPLWSMNRPEVHDVVRGLRRVADEFPGRVLVGETYLPVEEMVRYLGDGRDDEFHLAFDFEPLLSPWEVRHLALAIERAEALHPPGAWPTYAFSNHDQSRQATRWGEERARAAAFLLLTLRGVAVLYAGEEIGMVDADPATLPSPPFDRAGRDGVRTPMQWDASGGGGFTTGTPVAAARGPGAPQRRRTDRRRGLAAFAVPPADRGAACASGARPWVASVRLRGGAGRPGLDPRGGRRAGARRPQPRRGSASLRVPDGSRRRTARCWSATGPTDRWGGAGGPGARTARGACAAHLTRARC